MVVDDASDSNTIDIANLAPGEHKVRIVLVDAAHNLFPGQEVTLRFTIPERVPVYHRTEGVVKSLTAWLSMPS